MFAGEPDTSSALKSMSSRGNLYGYETQVPASGPQSWHFFSWWLWEHAGSAFSGLLLWKYMLHSAMLTWVHCSLFFCGFFFVGGWLFLWHLKQKEALCKWLPLPFPPTLTIQELSLSPCYSPLKQPLWRCPFFRGRNWGTEMLSNLPL